MLKLFKEIVKKKKIKKTWVEMILVSRGVARCEKKKINTSSALRTFRLDHTPRLLSML